MSKCQLWLRLTCVAAALLGLGTTATGATLTIALSSTVNTLDPEKTTTVGTDLSVISHIYTPLVERGPDLKLRPALATSWQAISDNVWRFVLRDGVAFPDGEPLDAAAVAWNVKRILDPRTGARNKPWYSAIREIRVVDAHTIDFVTDRPFPALPAQMAMLFLLPPRWSRSHNLAMNAMGTGPYELKSFSPGDQIVLSARPDYWGDAPRFDRVVFKIIPEESSQIASLLTGEVNFISGFPTSEIGRINHSGRAHADAVPSTRAMFIRLNALKEPFRGNPKLWKALNYAVDKKAINDALLDGKGQLEDCQILSDAYFGFNPDLKPVPYDPAKARQLLNEAGYPDGLTIDMEVPTGRYMQSSDIAQAVAAQFEEVNVKVRMHEMDFGVWINKYLIGRNLGVASYTGVAWPTLEGGSMFDLWQSKNPQAFWDDVAYDRAVRLATSTLDDGKRAAAYRTISRAMCDASPIVFLFFTPTTYALTPDVRWSPRGDDWVRAMDMEPR
ncbi:Dipeptide-binding protein ABC transporter, periplasmic substrate-binding protein component [Paraburkholderia piptadeniae]|uniref:Dipeptide-binding protein ABC transporter, periplasmic substrate-binding protein component n=1 Tax=Paraburkholderia piptadeniae TaxID=1701573 RepID=A0A1N7SPW2_9BURK|nr:ABC transporter substrate-binding protein [Paraburkholderia piptadeniae]SIT49382.1 Dipeptide-binding protein ABC transporter, periplasmic substrate-binding protein component [Paraburkholderia piptadeniae]